MTCFIITVSHTHHPWVRRTCHSNQPTGCDAQRARQLYKQDDR